MKKILGLDLGVSSIGWAVVNEAEDNNEKSSIVRLGVRVNPLTTDEQKNFEEGKSITTNADRTLKRSARRNLQRFRLRRNELIKVLKAHNIISDNTCLTEKGKNTTFETLSLRAKSVNEKVSLEEFARILLSINSKRGYKSNRKVKQSEQEDGQLIDSMDVATELLKRNITPAQYCLELLEKGTETFPDFYRSDLQNEFERIWNNQKQYHSKILTDEFKLQIQGRSKTNVTKIFLAKYNLFSTEIKGNKKEIKQKELQLRVDALTQEITQEELVYVVADINGQISRSSGYLGAISDRSKELRFGNLTVGQYLYNIVSQNPNASLKNLVFYRQDYIDEFNKIWDTQAKYYPQLNSDLKKEIKDSIIFYQRKLKSQKGLLDFCIFESKEIEVIVDGKKKKKRVGLRVCPKSSPLFQEFRIWQILNNLRLISENGENRYLEIEERDKLFEVLQYKEKLKKSDILKLLLEKPKGYTLNYEEIIGNTTFARLYSIAPSIKEDAFHFDSNIDFQKQLIFRLWHLLYSYEDDNTPTGNGNLIARLENEYGFTNEEAKKLANVSFEEDYSNLSSKAIRKILPFLKEGYQYSDACEMAGYNHSAQSLTKEQIEQKILQEKLELLSKNSLRNPVVEKILNQMVNVVNEIIEEYGKPDEIRIELARELKKSAAERESMTKAINENSKLNEKYTKEIQQTFGFKNVSRNDIVRYKLYKELEHVGYKTLYSNTYIAKEDVFSKKFDIEHIIPQSKLFDDSFSNKTLELRDINIEKGNETAYDFVASKYGEEGLQQYLNRIEDLWKNKKISTTKYKNLKTKNQDISKDFINRDLKDSQYIAKKAREILLSIVKVVNTTTGSITDRLREDWQIVNVMQELNWDKYDALGLTEVIENKDGEKIRRIKDWTKRNDHRHHAMDALTIAFTKHSYIQYLNELNTKNDKSSNAYAIENKELYRDDRNKLLFKPPMPLNEFRQEVKQQLENVLVSIKAKNKVVTQNINKTKKKGGTNIKIQLTPRGQLHKETIYGERKRYVTKEEKVGSSFSKEKIMTVCRKDYREALLKRLEEYYNDPKKAFTGKNSLEKTPVYYNLTLGKKVPEKVKTVTFETIYTIRKEINKDLSIDKVVDSKVKQILKQRLEEYDNDSSKAFSNLDENPIWLNKEKGISIKRVTITAINNAEALHDKKDNNGNIILDNEGNKQPADFVSTGNNHHVAIYRDENGDLQENIVSFYEATARAINGETIIDKNYNADKGWKFLFTMKQNEYFLFPDDKGFNPTELTEDFIKNENNYSILSPHLFRVQSMSKVSYGNSVVRDYIFRHHLETNVNSKQKDVTYKQYKSLAFANNIVKVRVNHLGKIVAVGEY